MKKKLITLITLGTLAFGVSNATIAEAATKSVQDKSELTIQNVESYEHNLLHTSLDAQGRPYQSTFLGKDLYEEGKRVGSPQDPYGMKWQQRYIREGGRKKTVWDRGHLVGNQFAGHPSNESKNIVPETSYTNQTLMTYFEGGRSSSNANALDNWLKLHPNYYLDYQVTANYGNDSERYPRSITLRYRGVDAYGSPIRIQLPNPNVKGVSQLSLEQGEYTSVTIANFYPGYTINYQTGELKAGEDEQSLKLEQELPPEPSIPTDGESTPSATEQALKEEGKKVGEELKTTVKEVEGLWGEIKSLIDPFLQPLIRVWKHLSR